MTTKTLTDSDGDTLRIEQWRSGRVSLVTYRSGTCTEVGPFDPADVIAAIREVAGTFTAEQVALTDAAAESARRVQAIIGALGETCCDATSPGNGYLCTRERGHITEHVATTIDGEVRETWPVETDDKPEPAPSKSPTAEDFARAQDWVAP